MILNNNSGLTPRHIEIIRLFGECMNDKEIARTLRISVKTVQFHIHAIFKIMGYHNRLQLLKLAVAFHLASLLFLMMALVANAEGPLLDVTNSNPRLQWDYPTNYMSGVLNQLPYVTNSLARQQLTNLWYFCYWTANAQASTNWTLFAITNNPTTITTSDGRWVFEVPLPQPVQPQAFFAVGVSNYLGLTFFGGLAATPPLLPKTQQNFHLQ